ncbi:MAG: hypothetical protein KAR06_07985 [Deltaproteobacteria bacterium]|nr:hypothetical protein [Deltaproteobacteria bacterium]
MKSDDKCVVVGGVHYVPEQAATGDIKIVVLQRGHVMVGRFSQEGDTCKLMGASVIRVWGTTKGLGEIAYEGPTSKTKLDKCPDITFHILTSILIMDCVEETWETHCR